MPKTKTKATARKRQNRSLLSSKVNFNSPGVVAVIALVIAVGGYLIYKSFASGPYSANSVLVTSHDSSINKDRYFAVNDDGTNLKELAGVEDTLVNPVPSKYFGSLIGADANGTGAAIYNVASGAITTLALNSGSVTTSGSFANALPRGVVPVVQRQGKQVKYALQKTSTDQLAKRLDTAGSTALVGLAKFSPNSAHIAYVLNTYDNVSNQLLKSELYTANPDGTNIKPVVTGSTAQITNFDWQPGNGYKIAYTTWLANTSQGSYARLYVANSDGSHVAALGPNFGFYWANSGGKLFINHGNSYNSADGGYWSQYAATVNPDGSGYKELTVGSLEGISPDSQWGISLGGAGGCDPMSGECSESALLYKTNVKTGKYYDLFRLSITTHKDGSWKGDCDINWCSPIARATSTALRNANIWLSNGSIVYGSGSNQSWALKTYQSGKIRGLFAPWGGMKYPTITEPVR